MQKKPSWKKVIHLVTSKLLKAMHEILNKDLKWDSEVIFTTNIKFLQLWQSFCYGCVVSLFVYFHYIILYVEKKILLTMHIFSSSNTLNSLLKRTEINKNFTIYNFANFWVQESNNNHDNFHFFFGWTNILAFFLWFNSNKKKRKREEEALTCLKQLC